MTASAGSAGVESTLCTRISSPTIATRSVNVPPVSIPTIIGTPRRRFTLSPSHDALSRILKLRGSVAASKAARIDLARGECVERGLKPAASRADHRNFVHYNRREVDLSGRGHGALQYD